ncbi:MAG: chemotaxis protein CheD [Proteobacteria bacterium]|nr:chemotaxis protein CheD [Pseudomonadota bacterium]
MMTGFSEYTAVYLKAAELFVGQEPAVVSTVLGSCVAVTMFHRHLVVAAICHALLPTYSEKTAHNFNGAERFRYVNRVIPEMVKQLQSYGAKPKEIEVKLFGGAEMFGRRDGERNTHSVGAQNITAAVKGIESEGLQLKIADIGGLFGRKILFHTHTGEVLLKYLK